MKRGIVVHHGSLPLEGRKIIEEFTRKGHCRLCFATSTLDQGINMPFDLVWIDRFEPSKPLNVKNLIGRAGRSTKSNAIFDFGQIVIDGTKKNGLRSVITNDTHLSEISQLDAVTDVNDDYREYKEAIKNDKFNEEYNMTNLEVDRVSSSKSCDVVTKILEALFVGEKIHISPMIDSKMSAEHLAILCGTGIRMLPEHMNADRYKQTKKNRNIFAILKREVCLRGGFPNINQSQIKSWYRFLSLIIH